MKTRVPCSQCLHQKICKFEPSMTALLKEAQGLKRPVPEGQANDLDILLGNGTFFVSLHCTHFRHAKPTPREHPFDGTDKRNAWSEGSDSDRHKWEVDEEGDIGLSSGAVSEEKGEETHE